MGVSGKPAISSSALSSLLSLSPTAAIKLMHTTRLVVQTSHWSMHSFLRISLPLDLITSLTGSLPTQVFFSLPFVNFAFITEFHNVNLTIHSKQTQPQLIYSQRLTIIPPRPGLLADNSSSLDWEDPTCYALWTWWASKRTPPYSILTLGTSAWPTPAHFSSSSAGH